MATWGQPALMASSWAYVAAALVLLVWGWRRPGVPRGWLSAFCAGLALTGLGSVDYHGPALGPEPLFHDSGLALTFLIALGIDLAALGVGRTRVLLVLAGGLVAGAAVLVLAPQVSPALAGVVAAGLAVTEVLIYRRGLRRPSAALWAALTALGIGAIVFSLSRTSGPLCDPNSWLQGHAVWHVMTALALALWATTALTAMPAMPPNQPVTQTPHSAPDPAEQPHSSGRPHRTQTRSAE